MSDHLGIGKGRAKFQNKIPSCFFNKLSSLFWDNREVKNGRNKISTLFNVAATKHPLPETCKAVTPT
jgi:hypothetical protein